MIALGALEMSVSSDERKATGVRQPQDSNGTRRGLLREKYCMTMAGGGDTNSGVFFKLPTYGWYICDCSAPGISNDHDRTITTGRQMMERRLRDFGVEVLSKFARRD